MCYQRTSGSKGCPTANHCLALLGVATQVPMAALTVLLPNRPGAGWGFCRVRDYANLRLTAVQTQPEARVPTRLSGLTTVRCSCQVV